MTSLIVKARVTSYELFYISILGDNIFLTLEHIKSNQPYYTTMVRTVQPLLYNLGTHSTKYINSGGKVLLQGSLHVSLY